MKSWAVVMKVNVIIPCGGSGSRANMGKNKILCELEGDILIKKTLSAFLNNSKITKIILPININEAEAFKEIIKTINFNIVLCSGGKTRSASVNSALAYCDDDCDIILIHDGARPYVSQKLIETCIVEAQIHGSAIAATPTTDTIAKIDNWKIIEIPMRNQLYNLQTPQAFKAEQIKLAYAKAQSEFTDDSGVYNRYIAPAHIVLGETNNKKITTNEDFIINQDVRVGCGYDTHRLVENRKLILGGIEIEHDKGLLGHSDADVLTHAIMDAILTACGKRDIGVYFPDTDNNYKNISSITLLEKVMGIINNDYFYIHNISAVLMCEKPKLATILPIIANNLANILKINTDMISISATTCEGIGLIGREEGIACHVICSCFKNKTI